MPRPLPTDESLRPKKAKATKPGQPTLHVPLTDDEWREFLDREDAHKAKMAERAKNKHLLDREEAYQREVYPFMQEALAAQQLDDNPAPMNKLKAKRREIEARFPAPAPE